MGKATCGASDRVLDELCTPPEVCANAEDNKRQHLLNQSADDSTNVIQRNIKRDKSLLIAILVLAVVLHLPYLKFLVYPFLIFSTWVHESSHGMAAVLVGGGVNKLYIYKDGSGLAYTYTDGSDWKRAFVASAGYTGTAAIGCLLLLFRRTRRGPTTGLIGMGCIMLLSVAFYVRNAFGIVSLILMGLALILCGWKLPAQYVLYLYCFMAATCSFNALDSINDLRDMDEGEAYVNGQKSSTDAHSVADLIGMTYGFWAVLWLLFALVMSAIGMLFPFDGATYNKERKRQTKALKDSLPQHGVTNNSFIPASRVGQQAPPPEIYDDYVVASAPPMEQASAPPATVEPSAPPPPMNPAYSANQHPWQQTEVPVAQATLY